MFYSILILRLFQTLRLLSEGVTFHIQQMERSDDRSSQFGSFFLRFLLLLLGFKSMDCFCFRLEEPLSNAVGLLSVILPLSVCKWINEIVEERRRRLASPIHNDIPAISPQVVTRKSLRLSTHHVSNIRGRTEYHV